MQLTNIELKSAVLHEAAFMVGLGSLGPHLGTGGTTTPSRDAKLFLSSGLLIVRHGKYELLIPLSNVKSMVPFSPIED